MGELTLIEQHEQKGKVDIPPFLGTCYYPNSTNASQAEHSKFVELYRVEQMIRSSSECDPGARYRAFSDVREYGYRPVEISLWAKFRIVCRVLWDMAKEKAGF